MRTTTKRILSTPYWIIGTLFVPFIVLGAAFEFAMYWFNAGRQVHKAAVDLFDPKRNDIEHRV